MTGNADNPLTFEEAIAEHLDALYRTAVILTGGRTEEAEDLLQDTVVRGLRYWEQLQNPGSARAWLFRILHHTHLNRERAAGRRREISTGDLDEASLESALAQWRQRLSPEHELQMFNALKTVQRAINSLPQPWRTVFWMVDVEGFTLREAADILAVPEGTVASRLYRGRSCLSKELSTARRRLWER